MINEINKNSTNDDYFDIWLNTNLLKYKVPIKNKKK